VVERIEVVPIVIDRQPGAPAPAVVDPGSDRVPAQPTVPAPAVEERRVVVREPGDEAAAPAQRGFRFEPGWNRATAELASGLALLAWALAGRWIGHGWMSLSQRVRPSPDSGAAAARNARRGGASAVGTESDQPRALRTGEVHRIRRPDGSDLRVECYGPADAPTLVLTHGWGASSEEWYYEKTRLADRFRLIVWDEPGLGCSKGPDNHDYRLEKMATDLEAVLALAGDRPVVLVGHSIGGMILQTFCRLFPETLARRVAGLALVHTTYTNPLRTAQRAAL
jgi:hypothetical protein